MTKYSWVMFSNIAHVVLRAVPATEGGETTTSNGLQPPVAVTSTGSAESADAPLPRAPVLPLPQHLAPEPTTAHPWLCPTLIDDIPVSPSPTGVPMGWESELPIATGVSDLANE